MAMLGAAEISANQDLDRDQTANYRNIILRNGRHLLALINDLLDAARMEAGKIDIHRRRCSLPDILANVRAATSSLSNASEVALTYRYETPIPAQIETDATRLAQALINLVNNALKFTHEGSVQVSVAVARDEPDPRLTIKIQDTGVGIPKEAHGDIFESFAQIGRPSTGSVGGVGLGLPLARAITEQLGGSLGVESRVGEGSTFTLRVATGDLVNELWITPSELGQTSVPAPDDNGPPEKLDIRILLAEDFVDTRELVRVALDQAGASVVAVENGQKAIDAVVARSFDLILLDARMPGVDGRTAASRIREIGCHTPMVALTASTASDELGSLLEAGFDDVWAKPISIRDLLRRVAAFAQTLPGHEAREVASAATRPQTPPPRTEFDRKLLEIRVEFVASLPDRIEILRQAARTRDRSVLTGRLHQLIGSSGIHELSDISEEAARLLKLARTGNLDGQPEAFDRLDGMVHEAIRRLNHPQSKPEDRADPL